MPVLRIFDAPASSEYRRIEVTWQGEYLRRAAVSQSLLENYYADEEMIRWYLEDYAGVPGSSPRPTIARGGGGSTGCKNGADLFREVFSDPDSHRRFGTRVRDRLGQVRVEVEANHAEESGIGLWEFLAGPGTDAPVVLGAGAFSAPI